MRLLPLALIISSLAAANHASAEEFRCFSQYEEAGNKADLFFYGEIFDRQTKNFRFEFLGENGFFLSSDLAATRTDFAQGKRLNITSKTENEASYRLITAYQSEKGNYLGQLKVERDGKSAVYPLRCVILRGI